MLGSNLDHQIQRKKENMGRQILTVWRDTSQHFICCCGGYLTTALGQWPQTGPALARYVVGPIIAVLVGFRRHLRKISSGLLACLSLLPSTIVVLAFRA